MTLSRKLFAEAFGTFWLVFGGCGSAVLAAGILGATDSRAPAGFAPIPIGLALCLIHLIGIPVTNVSVNPARSTGPALFVGGWALEQLWVFWLAPIAGAALAGVVYPALFGSATAPKVEGVEKSEVGTLASGA